MLRFFRFLWSMVSWTRVFVFNVVFLILVAIIIISAMPQENITINNNSALVVAPSGFLVDQRRYNPGLSELLNPQGTQDQETVLRDVINAINHSTYDSRITGLVLKLDYLYGGGMSKIEELGEALNNFKKSGKPIIAYADNYTQQQYLLASYADTIYLNEMGSVLLTGYGMYRNYLKDAADKLHVKFNVFRAGSYKDAIEPYTRNNMSLESREHNTRWIKSLWQRYTQQIENSRDLEEGSLDHFIRSMNETLQQVGGSSAELAKNAGLIDHAVNRLELNDQLINQFGAGKGKMKDTFSYTALNTYLSHVSPTGIEPQGNIGLIVASGNIVGGHQPEGSIGGESLSQLIKQARQDKDLKALVIRVDSGGGSAFASELIRQQIIKTRETLPVYISMGSMAASGGYWIASAANEIWATPATLTGSIGVWGLFPNVTDSLNKLGIYTDGISTTPLADAFRADRKLSPEARQIMQSSIENIYQRFLTLVAEARQSTPEAIHKIAEGRVWTGQMAHELGLVDQLGSLSETLAAAAKKQGLDKYSVKMIERELSPREQIIRTLMSESAAFKLSVTQQIERTLLSSIKTLFAIPSATDNIFFSAKYPAFAEHTGGEYSPLNTTSHTGIVNNTPHEQIKITCWECQVF